jgi:serine/threonine protein kinase
MMPTPSPLHPAIVTSLITTVNSFNPLGVIHRDLNSGNILISSNPPRGIIIDFLGLEVYADQ